VGTGAPSGTVTFLFTDVEGSTGLWEASPDAMRVALERHDSIIRSAIDGHDGYVFSTGGDGFGAAFARAGDCLSAAVSAQDALAAEQWPVGAEIRVRMGLHTGEVEERDGDYFGTPVNQAARLMAVGHGGQVLASESVESLVRDELPDGVTLVSLGDHRLRNLTRTMGVFQVAHPRMPREFPPLRSLSVLLGNLPVQMTSFVGREGELRDVRRAMEATRLVTLTGVGGAGKTRLALQFAAEAQPRFRNGAWLCEFAPLTSPDAVAALAASVLGVEARTDRGLASAIAEALERRQALIVLDNCEHVLAAAADLADVLIRSCPEVVVVATSREALGVAGERVLPVGSLTVPAIEDRPDVVRKTDAVRLFVSRAQDVRPLPDDEDGTIAEIAKVCRRLDGIPLAIELAAAQTQSLSVAEIAGYLDDRFTLLTRGARTALSRHQTLRAAIDWSFDLLSHGEQRVLTAASVFAGGFTLDAAAAVCEPDARSALEIFAYLDGLVRRSMLLAEVDATTTRYRMLETIRQYAADRLDSTGDVAEVRRAHLEWCTGFARESGEGLRSPNDAAWLGRVERELDNFRGALRFAASIGDFDAAKILLASAPMGSLWDSRLGASMSALAKEVASVVGEPDHSVSAALLSLLALDAALRFAVDEAVELAERACAMARRQDDWLRTGPWLAWMLSSLIANRSDTVMAVAREALVRSVVENDAFAVAEWNAQLGIAHWITGDIEEAQRLTDIGLTLAEEVGADNLVMRNAFLRGASLLAPRSDPAVAFTHLKRAVLLGERVGGSVLYGGAAWAVLLADRGAQNISAIALARDLASHLPTPMFLIDTNGMLVFYNDAAALLIGKPFAEVGEIPSAEFGHSLDLETIDGQHLPNRDSAAGVAFFDRRPAHQKLIATGYDGRRHELASSAYPLFGAGNAFWGVLAVFWEHASAGLQSG
jgi:predicted ATPase/class 3 adenylate cyclase